VFEGFIPVTSLEDDGLILVNPDSVIAIQVAEPCETCPTSTVLLMLEGGTIVPVKQTLRELMDSTPAVSRPGRTVDDVLVRSIGD